MGAPAPRDVRLGACGAARSPWGPPGTLTQGSEHPGDAELGRGKSGCLTPPPPPHLRAGARTLGTGSGRRGCPLNPRELHAEPPPASPQRRQLCLCDDDHSAVRALHRGAGGLSHLGSRSKRARASGQSRRTLAERHGQACSPSFLEPRSEAGSGGGHAGAWHRLQVSGPARQAVTLCRPRRSRARTPPGRR